MPLKDIVILTLCSMMGVVGNQFLYVKGLSLTTVINVTLLSTTIPVYALVVSILFGYDKWSFKRLGGIVLSMVGVIYLINPGRADLAFHATAGNLLILTNSFLYAIYIVISKDLFERYGALNVITWIFLVGSVVTVPVRDLLATAGESCGDWDQRVGGDRVHNPLPHCRCLLSERLGVNTRFAEHGRDLHLSATARRLRLRAIVAW
jgi:hypothetical protein